MRVTIDRFEADTAVLELSGGGQATCSRRLLPPECREGDILDIIISVDPGARVRREKEVSDLQDRLKNRNQ